MKYKDKYPNMKPIHDERHGIIRTYPDFNRKDKCGPAPCHVCDEITEFVEINYEGPFCSEECLAKFESKFDL